MTLAVIRFCVSNCIKLILDTGDLTYNTNGGISQIFCENKSNTTI